MDTQFKHLLNGELLGDGSLMSRSTEHAEYRYGTKHEEYANWLASVFSEQGFGTRVTRRDREVKGKTHEAYDMVSLTDERLRPVYERWYPSGERTPPGDLQLAPVTLRQWYIGDGMCSTRAGGNASPEVQFTNRFSEEEGALMLDKLASHGIEATQLGHGALYVRVSSHERLLEYMADLPECLEGVYGYKWEPLR